MIFGMELLSKGNKISSVYQGRCVCVLGEGSEWKEASQKGGSGQGCVCLCVLGEGNEWKGASWNGGSTKEGQ